MHAAFDIVNRTLIEDFGFSQFMWVFSGLQLHNINYNAKYQMLFLLIVTQVGVECIAGLEMMRCYLWNITISNKYFIINIS